jgi:hypothetical protein
LGEGLTYHKSSTRYLLRSIAGLGTRSRALLARAAGSTPAGLALGARAAGGSGRRAGLALGERLHLLGQELRVHAGLVQQRVQLAEAPAVQRGLAAAAQRVLRCTGGRKEYIQIGLTSYAISGCGG